MHHIIYLQQTCIIYKQNELSQEQRYTNNVQCILKSTFETRYNNYYTVVFYCNQLLIIAVESNIQLNHLLKRPRNAAVGARDSLFSYKISSIIMTSQLHLITSQAPVHYYHNLLRCTSTKFLNTLGSTSNTFTAPLHIINIAKQQPQTINIHIHQNLSIILHLNQT